jgi:hypothetical protein
MESTQKEAWRDISIEEQKKKADSNTMAHQVEENQVPAHNEDYYVKYTQNVTL